MKKNRLILCLVVFGPAILLASLIIPALPKRMGQTKADILYINAALTQYRRAYRILPAGDSTAMFQALMSGDNARKVPYLVSTRTNLNNQPLDYWGTPYQIEKLDDKKFLIRSAGPDRQFSNEDDYVFDGDKLKFIEKR